MVAASNMEQCLASTEEPSGSGISSHLVVAGSAGTGERVRYLQLVGAEHTMHRGRAPLRVDVYASPVGMPSRDRVVARRLIAPVVVGGEFGDANSINSMNADDAPFVIARKLLRRRHVRKEQIKKERAVRDALLSQDKAYKKTKVNQHENEPRQERSAVDIPICLPHPSPMIFKSISFSDMVQTTPSSSPEKNNIFLESNQTIVATVAIDGGADVAASLASGIRMSPLTSITALSFSPIRSRTKRSLA